MSADNEINLEIIRFYDDFKKCVKALQKQRSTIFKDSYDEMLKDTKDLYLNSLKNNSVNDIKDFFERYIERLKEYNNSDIKKKANFASTRAKREKAVNDAIKCMENFCEFLQKLSSKDDKNEGVYNWVKDKIVGSKNEKIIISGNGLKEILGNREKYEKCVYTGTKLYVSGEINCSGMDNAKLPVVFTVCLKILGVLGDTKTTFPENSVTFLAANFNFQFKYLKLAKAEMFMYASIINNWVGKTVDWTVEIENKLKSPEVKKIFTESLKKLPEKSEEKKEK